ncbi:MAG: helix-turn-helix transcriptional regulator [Bryobacterales bacterium]|nr:helix-turn-helix transcriptional regulator [Bryobacterales bacterium]
MRVAVEADAAASGGDGQEEDEPGDTMAKLENLKQRSMQDPEFRAEYARADEGYALVEAMIRAQTAANLIQSELAARIGTTQSAIARLEGGRLSPSIRTLRRYAEATGTRLTLGFERADG